MFETIAATAAAFLITLLVLMYLAFRTPKTERPTGRLTRDLQVHTLLDRLEPGDRILVTEKRGRTVGKRGGTETTFLGVDRKGMRLRTTVFCREFHRDPGDLVRLVS